MPKGRYPLELRQRGPRSSGHTRFWAKVDKNGPEIYPGIGPCWLWTGAIFASGMGYGQFQFQGSPKPAHRVAWFLANNEWPDGDLAHRCDVPRCVRLSHLFEATPLENNRDMNQKHRNPKSGKLTEDQVLDIIRRRSAGEMGGALAIEYGVSDAMISMIWNRREWAVVGQNDQRPTLPRGGRPQKLTADDVRKIRSLHEEGIPTADIARQFHVAYQTAYGIVRRTLWPHIV